MTKASEPLHLGAVPPELLDKIFSELDSIQDLANFIFAARFVCHRFRARRRTILFRILQNELGPALPDARFLFVFPYADPADDIRYYDWLDVMADVYRGMLRGGEGQGVREPPALKELTELCRTLHLVNCITDTYATVQLASFELEGGGGTPAAALLSRGERHRVMRAFYRRQIVSNAWASTRRPAQWEDRDSQAFSDTSTGLLAGFQPWDMQQIDHADYFIMRLCRALLQRAAEAAAPATGGGGEGREISPTQFGNLHAHLDHLVRYLRAHRGVAEGALDDLKWGKSLPDNERVRLEFEHRYQLLPLTSYWQQYQSQAFPDPVLDEQEKNGLQIDSFQVVGDGPGQVPFGWSDALRGRHIRRYGAGLWQIPWLPPWDNEERRWARDSSIQLWRLSGFTLWDRKRVEALKGLSRFEGLHTGFVLDPLTV